MKTVNGKKVLYNILLQKYCNDDNLSNDILMLRRTNLDNLINALFGKNNRETAVCVPPLTAEETLILRTHYGTRNKGEIQSIASIARTFNFSSNAVAYALKRSYEYFEYVINQKEDKYTGLTVFDALPTSFKYQNVSIGVITSGSTVRNTLVNNGILNLKDLLKLSKRNLSSIVCPTTVANLSSKVSEFGLVFLDDLSADIKRYLFANEDAEKVLDTDISWLSLSAKLEGILRYQECHTIRDAIRINNAELQNALFEYGITACFEKTNGNSINILDVPLSNLDFTLKTYNSLRRMGLTTLGELVQLTKEDMMQEKMFGKVRLEEIETVLESYGLHLATCSAGKDKVRIRRIYE